ncbi:MAG: 16S rRNA (guanine(527)-N(7))-methyltransferase RsmG [Gammaproteobacteria bacterium]|nr:MAG: 16S rRNA (guanine(527)-N(7))-methyltransferase RsmG [Gammaproteobacteria bacterium]
MGLRHQLEAQLSTGIDKLDLDPLLPKDTRAALVQFVLLLEKWNKTYNLTAVREPLQMVSRHLLDSLVVLPYLQGERIIDVGCGAGLPGIPLALASPDRQFVLLDSNSKKTRFVLQAVAELGLANVAVVQCRIEAYSPDKAFDTVIARAFSSPGDLIPLTQHLLAAGGNILAMQGKLTDEKKIQLPNSCEIKEIVELSVPGLDAERHLLWIRQAK